MPRSKKNPSRDVLQTIVELFTECAGTFPNNRVFQRALRMGVGLLTTCERGTLTSALSATGWTDRDWTAFYRVFSRDEWSPAGLFEIPKRTILERLPAGVAAVAALDDTKLRKSGKHTPGVSYQRDPMSPPFHTNLIPAQRFVQMSMSLRFRFDQPSASRCIPVDFRHAPPPLKPRYNASDEERSDYRKAQRTENLSCKAVDMICDLRSDLDRIDSESRSLIMTVDGSFTNRTVLKNLPDRTTLIGRVRKDARFFYPPKHQAARGRTRLYGEVAPTPEQVRTDPDIPWQSVQVFASGRVHDCEVKTVEPLLWQKAGADMPLRLVVIRPLSYRLSKTSKLLYRQPAFLICTDPSLPLEELVQAYFSRWDIEVNHRDEKQLIGVGQAQVRAPKSVDRAPAFAVAMYSLLLIAHGKCHGFDTTDPLVALPKWRRNSSSPRFRIPTGEILEQMRAHSATRVLKAQPNFTHFDERVARHLKQPKSSISFANAIEYAFT